MTSIRFMAANCCPCEYPLVLRPLCWVVGLFLHPAYESVHIWVTVHKHNIPPSHNAITIVWNCIHGYHATKQNIHHTRVLPFNEETYITLTYRRLSHPPPYTYTLSHIQTTTVSACVFIHKTAVLPEWFNPQRMELLAVTVLNKLPQQHIAWNDTNPYKRHKQRAHTCIAPATSFFSHTSRM